MPNMTQTSNRQSAIVKVLRMHPGVREAAVHHDGCDRFSAFVVPDDSYLDSVLGRDASGATMVRKWRKASDLSLLAKDAGLTPVGFNTTGWNSSYTRQPIAASDMQEWIDTTVASIFQLAPKIIYEIGCGTGLLLMRIAPQIERYVAVDVSPVALDSLKRQLVSTPSLAERIDLVNRGADNFEGIEENSFDTVVLNSVAQYFPDASYLTRVLEGAVRIVRPGGHIYVGDIRSLPLLPAFASSIEIVQAADDVGIEELRNRIRRRLDREQELLISPAYFLSLQGRLSKLSRVEIQPRHGCADNEMTRYRYNVILHVGHETQDSSDDEFLDWEEHKWTLDEIRSLLREHPNERIGIKGIENARIEKDLAALAALRDPDAANTSGELRHKLKQYAERGVHPHALIDLGTESSCRAVFFSWASCRPNGSFDAFFVPSASSHGNKMPTISWPGMEASALVRLTNAPGQRKLRDELTRHVDAHCRLNLVEGMIPKEITLVDVVPRRSCGDIDTLALLESKRNEAL